MSIVITPTTTHSATIIFLHGLGDSGHGWAPVMRMLSRSLPFIKFILPHAPAQRVTINGGARMPSWYDILSLEESDEREDQAGLMQSRDTVLKIVDEEMKGSGVPSERIIVGGFSQGGAVALLTGLTSPHNLGGVISLSSYMPIRKHFLNTLSANSTQTPVFMGHGTVDGVVSFQWGKKSAEALKAAGCKVTFKSYQNLDHSCNDFEIEDVREFIESILRADKSKDTL